MRKLILSFSTFALVLACLAGRGWSDTFNVTSSEDSAAAGTLRDAVSQANLTPGSTITFAVSNSITVFTPLNITADVTIEGGGTTVGSSVSAQVFYLTNGNVTIHNLAVVGWNPGVISYSEGFFILNAHATIQGCRIGTDWAESSTRQLYRGIHMAWIGNIIGGNRLAGEGNVISGNVNEGIVDDAGGNEIYGNIVGLNSLQTAALPNKYGIWVSSTYGSTKIGKPLTGYGNIIAGNTLYGVYINKQGTVQNNWIGVSSTDVPFANKDGVSIWGASALVGGSSNPADLERNIIAGNTRAEVYLAGGKLTGNFIGTNTAGTAIIPGATYKVYSAVVYDSLGVTHAQLGGTQGTGQGNLIAGGSYGVYLDTTYTTMAIFGNTICGESVASMYFANHANQDEAPPVIDFANATAVQGHAAPNEYIEVFRAEHGLGFAGGSLQFIGSGNADASGQWSVPSGGLLTVGQFVCATAMNTSNSLSSVFSSNAPVQSGVPTFTPTRTVTPIWTATPLPNGMSTVTATPTPSASPVGPGKALNTAQVFPNPAKSKVQFGVNLIQSADVKIVIFNSAGRKVAEVKEVRQAGTGQVLTWDCSHAADGIYLAKIYFDNQDAGSVKFSVMK
jgi:hypothetical protein